MHIIRSIPIFLLSIFCAVTAHAFDMNTINCVLSGDAAQDLVKIMNTQIGTEAEKIEKWKKMIEPADLPKQYVTSALTNYLSTRTTQPLPLASEIVKSCTAELLKPLSADHASFCYSITTSIPILFTGKRDGISFDEAEKKINNANFLALSGERFTIELVGVLHEVYESPARIDPTAFKAVYFDRCLRGNGSAFKITNGKRP